MKMNHDNQNHDDEHEHDQNQNKKRVCDFCNESTAVLYCKADLAKLCLACDNEVHSTNQLFTKHTRSYLCDICDSSSASIFCSTETLVLCQNCDWETHNHLVVGNVHHDRRPSEGFNGCPNVSEMCSIVGFEDICKKNLCIVAVGDESSDDFSDLFVWKSPTILCLDDLIGSVGGGGDGDDVAAAADTHGFQAMGVPPLPKNRNAACGKHQGEILRQLCKIANLDPDLTCDIGDTEPRVPEQSLQSRDMYIGCEHENGSDANPFIFPTYEETFFDFNTNQFAHLGGYCDETCLVPEKPSDSGEKSNLVIGTFEAKSENPHVSETEPIYPKVPLYEFSSEKRDHALSRYKEKKKTRRYDRHIRYESRKARAESRTRIKGRFAKIDR